MKKYSDIRAAYLLFKSFQNENATYFRFNKKRCYFLLSAISNYYLLTDFPHLRRQSRC